MRPLCDTDRRVARPSAVPSRDCGATSSSRHLPGGHGQCSPMPRRLNHARVMRSRSFAKYLSDVLACKSGLVPILAFEAPAQSDLFRADRASSEPP
jgi:hypothetical protein